MTMGNWTGINDLSRLHWTQHQDSPQMDEIRLRHHFLDMDDVATQLFQWIAGTMICAS